jgi:hypothetical protein
MTNPQLPSRPEQSKEGVEHPRWPPREPGAPGSGTEPATAKSPLRLRVVLAVFGVFACVVATIWLGASARDHAGTARGVLLSLAVVVAVAGLVAVADLVVLTKRIRGQ